MLRFIVPLQAAEVSEDWATVSKLCIETLKSMTRQTDPNFEVALICNQLPAGFVPHPRIKIIRTDLPSPQGEAENRMRDKWKKVRIGLAHYRDADDAHYMVVDADDRVSNKLSEFVHVNQNRPGWYFDRGLIYDWGFPWFYKRDRFDLICGTSLIVHCKSSLLPTGPDDVADDCYIVKYGHTRIKSFFDSQPIPLQPLPFVGAVYMLNTGQNHTKTFYLGINSRREKLKRFLSIRPITRTRRAEFNLWDI